MCDILFVRSREARPTSVPPKIELWGDSQHCCPPSQNFGGDSPSLPPMIYATVSDSINLRLIVGCILTISKVILTYFAPEILNRTHILLLGGQGQRPGLVLALPVGDQFATMTWLTVIL